MRRSHSPLPHRRAALLPLCARPGLSSRAGPTRQRQCGRAPCWRPGGFVPRPCHTEGQREQRFCVPREPARGHEKLLTSKTYVRFVPLTLRSCPCTATFLLSLGGSYQDPPRSSEPTRKNYDEAKESFAFSTSCSWTFCSLLSGLSA